eukprot:m.31795 g.31795  ORF g.31795 m.31795 type:complete len:311 (+) comp12103_c0_seq1:89-1021(+)
MRPNEHKQKRSAEYKKNHNLPAKGKGKAPTSKPSSSESVTARAQDSSASQRSFSKRKIQAQSLSLPLPENDDDDAVAPTYDAILAANEGRNPAADFATSHKLPVYNEFDFNPLRVFPTIDVERLGNIVQTVPLHEIVDIDLLPSDRALLVQQAQEHCDWLETQGMQFEGAVRDLRAAAADDDDDSESFRSTNTSSNTPGDQPQADGDAASSVSATTDATAASIDLLDQLLAEPKSSMSPSKTAATPAQASTDVVVNELEDELDSLLGEPSQATSQVEEGSSAAAIADTSAVVVGATDVEAEDLDFLDSMM